ncbi:MAG: helix-turn-helix domain-containing protein [Bacillota bacterium]|jgi:transcriptional regulator with XRE-family HTH domain
MSFANVFKTLRIKKELTQDQLAKQLKISKSAISMYENGNREPDFETLEIIADFFNVSMDVLLDKKPLPLAPLDNEIDKKLDAPVYDEALEIMREMYERPELRALFKTSKKVKPESIKAVDELLKKMAGEDNDE